ncbi:MAG: radical SAM protein [Candidatus Omnitrophota bacterium]
MKRRNKILLIEPLFHRLYKPSYSLDLYPLSLGYLAGAIKNNTDWEVMAYNADFTPHSEKRSVVYETGEGFRRYLDNLKNPAAEIWNEVRSVIKDWRPDVVGITAKSQNFKSACIIAKIAKECDKGTIVIMGGPHPSMVGEDIFACPEIDIGVKGEGEKTIVELLHAIRHDSGLQNISGVMYRTKDGVAENASQAYIDDLDSLRFPIENAKTALKDYGLYPKEAFRHIFATRGCPYNCVFCGSRNIWSRRVRFRSPDNIIEEIKLCQSMGLKAVSFEDDYFGVTRKYVFDLCNSIIRQCPGLKWACEIHVKLVDEETIAIMKKAGCFSIRLGIESGNDEMLKLIRKNITVEEALSAAKIIKKYSIDLHVFYMIGFPQETEETLMDTFSQMKNIPCDLLIYSIFTPYPGTEAFDLCKKMGVIGESYDVALYNHQSPMNYFCPAISKERFRELAGLIEVTVDKKNRRNRIKRMFSSNILWRIKEKGILESLRKGLMTLAGK